MPNELTDLALDEVSLVGKAANGKRFLIFKSMHKSKGSITMRTPKPAGAKAGAGEARVNKADLEAMIDGAVQKAIGPIAEENRELRTVVEKQAALLEDKELVAVAKSDFSELGTPEEMAAVLKSMKRLTPEERKPLLRVLRKSNAGMKEVGKMLYHELGSSHSAAPGTPEAEFNAAVDERLGVIQKSSDAPKNPRIARALATTWVTEHRPELYRALVGGEQ